MSTTSVSITMLAAAQEQFDATEQPGASSPSDRQLKANALSHQITLNPTSLPKVDFPPIYQRIQLGAGITTIDLTAVQGLSSPPTAARLLNMTGAKVKFVGIKTGATNNVAGVTVAPGAANPYPLFGTAKPVIFGPGRFSQDTFVGIESNLPAVAAGVKNIDLSGSLNDVVELLLAFGT